MKSAGYFTNERAALTEYGARVPHYLVQPNRCCYHHDEPNSDRWSTTKHNPETTLHHTTNWWGGVLFFVFFDPPVGGEVCGYTNPYVCQPQYVTHVLYYMLYKPEYRTYVVVFT